LALTALCYNWGFFTLLGYAPFPMKLGTHQLGYVFTAWGVLVAVFAVFAAPRLQARFGIAKTLYANLALFAVNILVVGLFVDHRTVLICAVIVAGVFIGVNNTVTTQAVMTVAPVDRPIASASYGFVRFIGGGLAPYFAGRIAEHYNVHAAFYVAAGAVALGIVILASAHKLLAAAESTEIDDLEEEALAEELGSAS
jgi:MFS family permease